MEGYVKNKSNVWRHAMKRSIGPNQTIDLNEIYNQYGVVHELEEGEQFINWLRQVKLRDTSIWEIVYNDKLNTGSIEEKDIDVEESKKPVKDDVVRPHIKKEITSNEIANMSVRAAREELKKITDIKLLKYSYEIARQLANKDTLCRMLRKRIQELEITRR